mgnify:CR=1 FL=1
MVYSDTKIKNNVYRGSRVRNGRGQGALSPVPGIFFLRVSYAKRFNVSPVPGAAVIIFTVLA